MFRLMRRCQKNAHLRKIWMTMKLAIFLFFLTISQLMATETYSQSTRISLHLKDVAVKEVLNEIEENSEFRFLYNSKLIDVDRTISADFENQKVSEILSILFRQTDIAYTVVDWQIVLTNKDDQSGFLLNSGQQQGKTITGKVTDSSGTSLPGVSVVVKGTTTGIITDLDGKYTLPKVSENAILQFSFVGMKMQEIAIGNKTTINVTLAEESIGIDEVVAVGYGTVKKKDLTGSIGSVGSKELKEVTVTRVEEALSGRVAGVQVKMADGSPGASPQIRIRGIGSISAGGDPLYVVDGYPTDNIQTLNPNNIESLDILKDASATAIYGSRGSNGVIIINTKRGMSGKTNITFDTYYGLQRVSRVPEFLNAMEQATYYYNSIRNWNLDNKKDVSGDPATWSKRVPQTVIDVMSGKNTTDVSALDAVLRTAPLKSYNLSVSGGNENVKYAVSGEYLDQDGIIINSNFKRYSLRTNLDAQLTKNLSLKININPSYTINNNVIASGSGAGVSTSIIGSATSAQPYYPVYNADGSYFIYRGIDASTDLYNPVALALEKKDVSTSGRILGNVNAEYKIMDGLKINVMMGATSSYIKANTFMPNLPVFFGSLATGSDNASVELNWLAEYTVNYTKSFGKHNISALAGYTVQDDVIELNSLRSNNYPNNLVPSLSAVSNIISAGTSSKAEWSIVSELARGNYNYDNKYFLTASIRRDGSSRFGANNKYGIFPSAAVSWRISNEKFMGNVPFVHTLKLRASYGETGNNNIGNYASLSTINYVKYTTGGVPIGGFAPGVIPNPNLTWETQQQFNGGLDLGFFKGRINLSLDHFISRNKDLLLNVNIPTSSGFSTALQNIGEVKNTGWEFVLSTINADGKFKWSTDFNLSTYKNEVVKLGPSGDPIISGNNITQIGQPIGMFYGLIVDGIFKNATELAAGPIYNKGLSDASGVGDIKFKDVSGPNGVPDGKIDNSDRTIIGSPYPDFYYGMTNRLSYRNFTLSFNITGSYGNQIYSEAFRIYRLNRSRSRTLSTERNYWKSEADPGDGVTPRPHDTTPGGIRLPSTRSLDTGTYIKINNVTLGYSLPNKISQRVALNSIRLYATATNPVIFTKNHSFNADVSNSGNSLNPGIDNNNYPLPKSIVFGVNISF